MNDPDRFPGPLARLWPTLTPERLADLLDGTALPRTLVPDAPDPRDVDRLTLERLTRAARAERGTAWPTPLAHAAVRFHRDGDRDEYQEALFARQRRLTRAVVLARLTGEDAWLDEAADGLVLTCELTSWCWPAHDDAFRRSGSILAVPQAPFLDLGAAEQAAQVAWADALLGPLLEARYPGLRARLRQEANARVFAPFLTRRDWPWIVRPDGRVDNWNPWIHAQVITAALALEDDPARRARLVWLALSGLDRFVGALPDDGACEEGYEYWWEGTGRLLEVLDLLARLTDGALDGFGLPAVRASVGFPAALYLGPASGGADWCVNYADSRAVPKDKPWHTLYRAAARAGDEAGMAHALAHRRRGITAVAEESAGLGRAWLALTDPDWTAGRVPGAGATGHEEACAPPLPAQRVYRSIGLLVARERADSQSGLTLVAKGGHNGEGHAHLDVGSVIVALDGVPLLADAGRPTYTAQTFSASRYDLWPMRSAWHNVPTIAGQEQGVGAAFAARHVRFDGDDAVRTFRADLAGAYPLEAVAPGLRWWRTVALHRRPGPARVELVDRWTAPLDGLAPTVEHLLLAGTVAALEPGRWAVTSLAGRRAILAFAPGDAPLAWERVTLDDPALARVWGEGLTRLSITVSDLPARCWALTITAAPDDPADPAPTERHRR